MTLRWIFLTAVAAFAITAAIIIGQRLNGEALAMLMGVVVGVVASLPGHYFLYRVANRTQAPPPAPALPTHTPLSITLPQPLPRGESDTPSLQPRRFISIGEDTAEVIR